MVDTVGADPMVAVMAVDTGKLLDSSTPLRRPAARSAGRFLFGLDPARNARPEMRSSWLRNWRGRILMRRR
jgi:hypothetical protein